MAIQINGDGTITGINVGGLPNGIVDTDMIAANAVTPAKSTIVGGKVLQVVSSEQAADSTNSTQTFADIGLSVSITPSSTSSKILVTAIVNGVHKTQAQLNQLQLRLMRDSTSLGEFATEACHSDGHLVHMGIGTGGATSALDSPNTTSQVTYKVQMRKRLSNTIATTAQYAGAKSYITVMEIAA